MICNLLAFEISLVLNGGFIFETIQNVCNLNYAHVLCEHLTSFFLIEDVELEQNSAALV